MMELFKAVSSTASASLGSIAIRSDQNSYSYHQLISSALKISKALCDADLKNVS